MSDEDEAIGRLWTEAIDRYESITKVSLEQTGPTIHSTEDIQQYLAERATRFDGFKNKRRKLWSSLDTISRPIQQLSGVAKDACDFFPGSENCLRAVTLLLDAARGVSDAYEAISDLLQKLGEFLDRLVIYTSHTVTPSLRRKVVEVLATLLEIIATATKEFDRGDVKSRLINFGHNVLLGPNRAIKALSKKLESQIDNEVKVTQAETYSATMELVQRTRTEQDNGDKAQERVAQLRQLLAPSEISENKRHAIRLSRVHNTCDWIQDQGAYIQWCSKKFPILWICGNPGHGKSYLCGRVVSLLQQTHGESMIASFFFQHDTEATQSFVTALKTIAFTLAEHDDNYASFLTGRGIGETDMRTVQGAFRVLLLDYFVQGPGRKTAYIVIDGIDESLPEDREVFLSSLAALDEASVDSNLQVIMSGRPHVRDELDAFLTSRLATIYVDSTKTSSDITSFVDARISKIKAISRDFELQRHVRNALLERHDGMFLYCNLMMQELRLLKRRTAIEEAISSMPKGLDDMTIRLLRTMSETCASDADARDINTILEWVTACPRSLSIYDLKVALREASSDGQAPLNLEFDLRRRYAAFFSIKRADGLTNDDFEEIIGADDHGDDNAGRFDYSDGSDVVFSHAHFGHFFSRQQPVAAPGHPLIGVDCTNLKVRILEKALRMDVTGSSHAMETIWKPLLKSADCRVENVPMQLAVQVSSLLATRFLDTEVIVEHSLDSGPPVSDARLLDNIVEWTNAPYTKHTLSQEGWQWAENGACHPSKLLYKMKEVYADEWLTITEYDESFKAELWARNLYHSIISFVRAEERDGIAADIDWNDPEQAASHLASERHPESAWRVAAALVQLQHPKTHRQAMANFTEAFELDDRFIYASQRSIELNQIFMRHHVVIQLSTKVLSLLGRDDVFLPFESAEDFNKPLEERNDKLIRSLRLNIGIAKAALGQYYEALEAILPNLDEGCTAQECAVLSVSLRFALHICAHVGHSEELAKCVRRLADLIGPNAYGLKQKCLLSPFLTAWTPLDFDLLETIVPIFNRHETIDDEGTSWKCHRDSCFFLEFGAKLLLPDSSKDVKKIWQLELDDAFIQECASWLSYKVQYLVTNGQQSLTTTYDEILDGLIISLDNRSPHPFLNPTHAKALLQKARSLAFRQNHDQARVTAKRAVNLFAGALQGEKWYPDTTLSSHRLWKEWQLAVLSAYALIGMSERVVQLARDLISRVKSNDRYQQHCSRCGPGGVRRVPAWWPRDWIYTPPRNVYDERGLEPSATTYLCRFCTSLLCSSCHETVKSLRETTDAPGRPSAFMSGHGRHCRGFHEWIEVPGVSKPPEPLSKKDWLALVRMDWEWEIS